MLAVTKKSKACLHEAAHAVTAVILGLRVDSVEVASAIDGTTDIRKTGETGDWELLVACLAGKQMEAILGRSRSLYWSSDWNAATQLASRLTGSGATERDTVRLLSTACELASSILSCAKPSVRAVATQLKNTGSATGDDCKRALSLLSASEDHAMRLKIDALRSKAGALLSLAS
mgnify:CR=1 FL=1